MQPSRFPCSIPVERSQCRVTMAGMDHLFLLLGLSQSFLKIERGPREERAVSGENTFLARSLARSLACNAPLRKIPIGISPLAASVCKPLASGEFLDAKYTSRLDFARLRLTISRRRHVSGARLGFFREYLDRHRPKRLNRSLCNRSQPEPACCTNIRARAVNGTKTVYRFWVGCIALRGRCLKSVSIRKAGKRIHMRLEMCSLRTRAVVKRAVTKSVNLFTRSRHHYAGHFSFHRPFLSD